MLIKTSGENLSTLFSTFIPAKAADHQVKAFEKDGVKEVKTAPDGSGRQQYRTNLTALHVDENGNADYQERDATLSVLTPVDVKIGVYYKVVGDVWVSHYITNNGRMGVSIVAEKVAPQTESKSFASAEKSA